MKSCPYIFMKKNNNTVYDIMALPNINDTSRYFPSNYRSHHRLDSNYNTPTTFDWAGILQNNPVDEVQELDKSEIETDSDSDSESETEKSKNYYKNLVTLKNKALVKQEKNNDLLRTLFKNVIEQQDQCQTIDSDVKSIKQNEITLHENYIEQLEKKVNTYKKQLQSETLTNEINKVKIEKIDKENNFLKKKTQCVVCRENDRSILFLPCKHCICCEHCSNNLFNNKCPTCRTEIVDKQHIFLN